MKIIVIAASLLLSGCTATQRDIAGTIAKTVGDLSPLVCSVLSAAGQPQAGTVCGTVAADVSAVSKLVQGILNSLPPADGRVAMPMTAQQPEGFTYRGATIIMAPAFAARVRGKLQVMAQ